MKDRRHPSAARRGKAIRKRLARHRSRVARRTYIPAPNKHRRNLRRGHAIKKARERCGRMFSMGEIKQLERAI